MVAMSNEEKILEILTQMRGDISDLKQGQARLETDVAQIKDRVSVVETDVTRLKESVVIIENEHGQYMRALGDGQALILDKLEPLPAS